LPYRCEPSACRYAPCIPHGTSAVERQTGVAAQPSNTDGLGVFSIGMDHEISHRWCVSLDGPWTDWVPLE
jgi:hypothetical protein